MVRLSNHKEFLVISVGGDWDAPVDLTPDPFPSGEKRQVPYVTTHVSRALTFSLYGVVE